MNAVVSDSDGPSVPCCAEEGAAVDATRSTTHVITRESFIADIALKGIDFAAAGFDRALKSAGEFFRLNFTDHCEASDAT
jgi:hypothetical protein